LTTASNTDINISEMVHNHPYIFASIVILLSILTSWQLWKYVIECDKYAKLDIIKARLKKPLIVNFANWLFGWLCIAFSSYCTLLFVKIIGYIAYMKGESGVELLSLIQLDISIIIFMVFTRNCLTTLTIIIKIIEETEINWKEYISLIIGFIALSLLIITVIGQYYHFNIQILLIVFIIDSIAFIISELNLVLLLSFLKEIIGVPWVKSGLLKLGWKGRLAGLGSLANASGPLATPGGQSLNQESVPSNREARSSEVQRGRGNQRGRQRVNRGQGSHSHGYGRGGWSNTIYRAVGRSLSPIRVRPLGINYNAMPFSPDPVRSKVSSTTYDICREYYLSFSSYQVRNWPKDSMDKYLLASGLETPDILAIKLKWSEENLIRKYENILKVITRDILDPEEKRRSTSKIELLHVDEFGNQTYKPVAIQQTYYDLVRKLYLLSLYLENINSDLILIKKIAGGRGDPKWATEEYWREWKEDLTRSILIEPIDLVIDDLTRPVKSYVDTLIERLRDTTDHKKDELESTFAQCIIEFKQEITDYVHLKNTTPSGTLRLSPLSDPNGEPFDMWANQLNGLRIRNALPTAADNPGLESAPVGGGRGSEAQVSPILSSVGNNIFRTVELCESEPESEHSNNDPNISRPTSRMSDYVENEGSVSRPGSRMSNYEPSNNGSNNNITNNNELNNNSSNNNGLNNNNSNNNEFNNNNNNNESYNNTSASRMSVYALLNNEDNDNISRPANRMSNSDPSNNGSTNNTRSYLGLSFGADYYNEIESFTNCIVSLFNDYMNDPIFYIIISFCSIIVLPFVLFFIDSSVHARRFRIFLLIKAIIFNVRKMITKGKNFQVPFRFSAFPWILAGDYNDFISEISNIFKGDFNWTSISVNPCFKWLLILFFLSITCISIKSAFNYCVIYSRVDLKKVSPKYIWLIKLGDIAFSILCIGLPAYSVIYIIKLVLNLDICDLDEIKLNFNLNNAIVFIAFMRINIATLNLIIKKITDKSIKRWEYFPLVINLTIVVDVIVPIPPVYILVSKKMGWICITKYNVSFVLWISELSSEVYNKFLKLGWEWLIAFLRRIFSSPTFDNIMSKGGGGARLKILKILGKMAVVPPLANPDLNAVPDNTNQNEIPMNRLVKNVSIGRCLSPLEDIKKIVPFEYNPAYLNVEISYDKSKIFFGGLTPNQRDYIATRSPVKDLLYKSGLNPYDVSEIYLKWAKQDLILSFQDFSKVITQKVLDPDGIISHKADFKLLAVERTTGKEYYVPVGIFTRNDSWALINLYMISTIMNELNPSLELMKQRDDVISASVGPKLNEIRESTMTLLENHPSEIFNRIRNNTANAAAFAIRKKGGDEQYNLITITVLHNKIVDLIERYEDYKETIKQSREIQGTLRHGPFNNASAEAARLTSPAEVAPISDQIGGRPGTPEIPGTPVRPGTPGRSGEGASILDQIGGIPGTAGTSGTPGASGTLINGPMNNSPTQRARGAVFNNSKMSISSIMN
jgi:hypothetical protein